MVLSMNRSTQIALVLLRLVIGWHFLFEGLHKIHSLYTPKPFSSEVYFREASGPLGSVMKTQGFIADPDKELDAKLQDGNIKADWNAQLSSFANYYALSEDQKKIANEALESNLTKYYEWFKNGKKDIEIPSPDGKPGGTIKTTFSTPQLISYYQDKIKLLEKAKVEDKSWYMGKDVDKARISSLKSDVTKYRKEIQDEIDSFNKGFLGDLQKTLKPEQKLKAEWTPLKTPGKIQLINLATIFGITAIGAGLFLGCFTRLACLGGIVFLAMTYLTVPPFPWLPVPPLNEGNYVFINKNIVEMFGMIVLMTTNSGKWFGLDGFLASLLPGVFGNKESA